MPDTISYEQTPQDVEHAVRQQLEASSDERAKAMQEASAILQLLYEQGILELVKEALGSGEKVIQLMTTVMENGQVVRTVRNLKTLAKLIGTVEPETASSPATPLPAGEWPVSRAPRRKADPPP